jgi:hypothetical protein
MRIAFNVSLYEMKQLTPNYVKHMRMIHMACLDNLSTVQCHCWSGIYLNRVAVI